jgi:hypothetical protein
LTLDTKPAAGLGEIMRLNCLLSDATGIVVRAILIEASTLEEARWQAELLAATYRAGAYELWLGGTRVAQGPLASTAAKAA